MQQVHICVELRAFDGSFSSCIVLPEVPGADKYKYVSSPPSSQIRLGFHSPSKRHRIFTDIDILSAEMFITTKNKSYRDSFSYRAGKATSKKKERSFKEKELSRSRTIATPQTARPPPTQSPSSSNPTSP